MREPWWARLLALLLDLLTRRQRAEAQAELTREQQEAADAVRDDYDAITGDDRTLDDAVDGLRARAAARHERDGDAS